MRLGACADDATEMHCESRPRVLAPFAVRRVQAAEEVSVALVGEVDAARSNEPQVEAPIEAAPVGFDSAGMPVRAGSCRLFIGKRIGTTMSFRCPMIPSPSTRRARPSVSE